MRHVSQERKTAEIVSIGHGFAHTRSKDGTEENVLLADLRYANPQPGDTVMLTYHSNGDILGKFIAHKVVDPETGIQ